MYIIHLSLLYLYSSITVYFLFFGPLYSEIHVIVNIQVTFNLKLNWLKCLGKNYESNFLGPNLRDVNFVCEKTLFFFLA